MSGPHSTAATVVIRKSAGRVDRMCLSCIFFGSGIVEFGAKVYVDWSICLRVVGQVVRSSECEIFLSVE